MRVGMQVGALTERRQSKEQSASGADCLCRGVNPQVFLFYR